MKPIELAGDLYREIKRRGLHLRKENGRDDVLLRELSTKLGCPDDRLQKFLDASDLSAESFLRIFLQVAEPFAKMFQEIWEFLSQHYAPKARETITVRFGFPDSPDQISVSLEQFRRYVETSRRVFASRTTRIWPYQALNGLFNVGRKLIPSGSSEPWKLYDSHGRYRPGEPYQLPILVIGSHPFDEVIRDIRAVFQEIIDEYASEAQLRRSTRQLLELVEEEDSESRKSLQKAADLLADLLTTWFYILAMYPRIANALKDDAYQEYNTRVRGLLRTGTIFGEVPLLAALDILDLPFWRHRWHTYEVWSTVLTLRSLQDYRPNLRTTSGYLPIDGYTPAIIADVSAKGYPSACVAAQVETPFHEGRRRAIKPDLRICFSDQFSPDQTAGVVEFKQRQKIDTKGLTEMVSAYAKGAPRSGGVLVLNYDVTTTRVSLPCNCHLVEGVQPSNKQTITTFQRRLSELLQEAHFEPLGENTMVLLDISSSMGNLYQDKDIQSYLRMLLGMKWIKVLRFNDGLVQGGDLDAASAANLVTSGGTKLRQALQDIERFFGLPDRLLIVTDGGHDHPTEMMRRISEVRECLPKEIEKNIDWLK